MGKVVQIEVSEWVDEDKLIDAIARAISQVLSRRELSAEDIRKILNIKSEDLTEELKVISVEKFRVVFWLFSALRLFCLTYLRTLSAIPEQETAKVLHRRV